MKQYKKLSHGNLKNECEDAIITLVGFFREKFRNETVIAFFGKKCEDNFDPEAWVEMYKDFIQRIAIAPVEECVEIMIIAVQTICFIFKTDNPWQAWIIERGDINKAGSIPDPPALFDWAKEKNIEKIKELCTTSGNLSVRLGYSILFLLPTIKVGLSLEDNPTARDSLWVRYGEILQKYPQGKAYLEKAVLNLRENTLKILGTRTKAQQMTRRDYYDYINEVKNNIVFHIWKPVMEALSGSIAEDLARAAEVDDSIRNVPKAIAHDYINEIESNLANESGMTRDEWREYREKKEIIEQLERKDENPPDELMQRYKELEQKRIRRIEKNIVHTESEDFEGTPTEMELPNEMVEYFMKNPERRAISAESREKICSELRAWAVTQPKQAHLAAEVVEYLIRAVTDPALDFEEAFQVTKIAEVVNTNREINTKTTNKEVREVLNRIRKDLPSLESLLD